MNNRSDDESNNFIERIILEEEIEIPVGVNSNQIKELYKELIYKYGYKMNKTLAKKFISEFKYRIGDLKPDNYLRFDLSEEKDSNSYYDLNMMSAVRLDAKSAAIMYKELRSNDLDMQESLNLTKILLETLW